MNATEKFGWSFALAMVTTAALFVGHQWLAEHDLRVHAEETAKAQAAVQSQAAEQVKGLQKQMADRDAAYQAQLQSLNTKFDKAVSPEQLSALAGQLMGLKAPIQLVTPAATAGDPHPQPVAQIAPIDFPQAKAYLQECESCKANMAKLTADAADRAAQAVQAQKEIVALQGEVQTWKTAAKGGSWIKRMGKSLKVAACAGVGGGIGATAGIKGGAVGALAGAVGCSLF